jgi:hypothetical protein
MATGFARMTPAERSLHGRRGQALRWSTANSPEARARGTQAARNAQRTALERRADPDGVLSPDELAAAVARLRQAHMCRMALASAAARRKRAA